MSFLAQNRFDATLIHTHIIALESLSAALLWTWIWVEFDTKIGVMTQGIAKLNAEAAE